MSADRDGAAASSRRGAGWASDLSWDSPEWAAAGKSKRDWRKLLLVVGLGILSWVATYVGMLELIEANMGELPLVHKVIIGFSVAMLMVMIIWLLDQLFSPANWFAKACYLFGYVFLTVISVGFGFGFYWKVLESRSESSRSAESAISQVQNSLHAAATRLEQLQATLESLTLLSTQKAEFERANGTSCPSSRPGDGPRRKMREDDAQRFTFASDFVKGRVGAVKGEMKGLDGDLVRIVRDDKSVVDARSGTRNEFMRQVGRKLELTVTGFNAFRGDPQLKQIRSDLAERAEKSSFADQRGGSFQCPDGQLQAALRGVVRAIDALPEIERPRIAVVEGSEAVIEAFRRLTATFHGAISFRMPPTPEELRELQKKAVAMAESGQTGAAARMPSADQAGLSRRDYIPLSIAIFVDLCLLLVSMGRPVNRLGGLVPKMRAAERGPVFQILSRFNQIHHDEETREKFEIFRHVVFDYLNDYYVAVPLDAPKVRRVWIEVPRDKVRTGLAERLMAIGPPERAELQREAHLLGNLFASFEQEKIFFRIDDRWLGRLLMQVPNVEAARRKLRRQGSKFSEAEAFRIYKFSDGAWSEIILGAVMGAARRADSDKARRAEGEPPARRVEEAAKRMPMSWGGRAFEPRLDTVIGPISDQVIEARHESPRETHYQSQYGPYARFVEPEADSRTWPRDPIAAAPSARPRATYAPRTAFAPMGDPVVGEQPANNNTAPGAPSARRAAEAPAPANVEPVPMSVHSSADSLIGRLEAATGPEASSSDGEPIELETMARQLALQDGAWREVDGAATAAAHVGQGDDREEPFDARSFDAPPREDDVFPSGIAAAPSTTEIDVDRITRWFRARTQRA